MLQTLQISVLGTAQGLSSTTITLVCTSTQAPLVMSINRGWEVINELLDIHHFLLTRTVCHAFIGSKGYNGQIHQRFNFSTGREPNTRGTKELRSP